MIPPGRLRRSAAGVPNGDATGAAGRWSSFAFPLASLGVHLAFIPVLVLLLPRRVEAIAAGQSPLVLSWLLLAGAVTAGIANVLAGYWSDRWLRRYGNRRGLIALGLAALMTAFVWFSAAKTIANLALAVIAFQFTLNLAFAPLAAVIDTAFTWVTDILLSLPPLILAAIPEREDPRDVLAGFLGQVTVRLREGPEVVGPGSLHRPLHPALPAVVGGEHEVPVVVEHLGQHLQILGRRHRGLLEVGAFVDEPVGLEPVVLRGRDHELPRSLGAGARQGVGLEAALDDRDEGEVERQPEQRRALARGAQTVLAQLVARQHAGIGRLPLQAREEPFGALRREVRLRRGQVEEQRRPRQRVAARQIALVARELEPVERTLTEKLGAEDSDLSRALARHFGDAEEVPERLRDGGVHEHLDLGRHEGRGGHWSLPSSEVSAWSSATAPAGSDKS